jgi:hypothetical protein
MQTSLSLHLSKNTHPHLFYRRRMVLWFNDPALSRQIFRSPMRMR